MIIVGVDPSLACTGIASMSTTSGTIVGTSRARTEPMNAADLPSTRRRIRTALSRVLAGIPEDARVAVLEAPSARSQYGSHNERVALYWFLVDQLLGRGLIVVGVGPKGRAKYATGNGNADKRTVKAAMRLTFPGAAIPDDNVADAVALVAMGARAWGAPIDGVISAKQQEAFDAVSWPVLNGRTK